MSRTMGRRGRRVSKEKRMKMSAAHRGHPSYIRTPETLAKLSEAHKGQTAWNKGQPRSKKTREKIAVSLSGFKHTTETCEKRRLVRLGKKHSPETRAKIAASLRGKPSGMLGKKHSLETRAKMSAAALRRRKVKQQGNEGLLKGLPNG